MANYKTATRTIEELRFLQNLPLEIKIAKSKLRIREWVNHFGVEGVQISFSGGKDSTVLAHLVREEYPDIPLVFVDTGLEYPEIKEFIKTWDNVTILRPAKTFKQVIEEYGYPFPTKEIAKRIRAKKNGSEWSNKYFDEAYKGSRHYVSKKYHILAEPDCPIIVSERCCEIMKKNPIKKYNKETGRVAFTGMTTDESKLRESNWLKDGCNAFNNKTPISNPLSFWKEQDILKYIKDYNIPIASVYGDVVEIDGKLVTTGQARTGCVFCMFGVQFDKQPNRFQRLYRSHPKLWEYCFKPKTEGGLELQQVLDMYNIPYTPEPSLYDYI